MSALSDLVKYAQIGDVIYKRGDHEHRYERAGEAAAELARLRAENAALRNALELIDHLGGYSGELARAARQSAAE